MNKLEANIAKIHNRKYCVLTGNGTTAIYLALIVQDYKNKKVVIPNNVCMNVVLPIYFSGNIPVFVDIEKDTLGLDIKQIPKEADALIAVHNYGNICEIKEIKNLCKKNNIFLIEDVAVADGLYFDNKPLGSFGDVSILSFGSGKNINIGHGGAILTDDELLFKEIKKRLPYLDEFSNEKEKIIEKISKYHTKLYNYDFGKSLNKYYKEFKNLCLENKNNFLFKFNNLFYKKLEMMLGRLEKLILYRQRNANFLKNRFKNVEKIILLEPKYNSSYWRFNIFVENYRDELFKYLLEKKYKVSSWYHSIDLLFEKRENINTPISDWVSENIINIWVNEEIDENYLVNISNDIINFLGDIDGKKV
jgi:dTDP-4-amino-4,6-dideoxygalactose transaminase